jgi:hypothetical protein
MHDLNLTRAPLSGWVSAVHSWDNGLSSAGRAQSAIKSSAGFVERGDETVESTPRVAVWVEARSSLNLDHGRRAVVAAE